MTARKKKAGAHTYRALFTADWQLCNSLPHSKPRSLDAELSAKPGLTDRFCDQLDVVAQIEVLAQKEKVDAVFFLGDLFEKSLLDAVTLTHGVGAVVNLSKVCPVYVLPGNHDAHGSAGVRFTPEVFDEIGADIKFLGGKEVLRPSGQVKVAFHPLPWRPPGEVMPRVEDLRAAAKKGETNVLLLHNSVVGCRHQGWVCDDGVDAERLCVGWELVLAGHFHDPQRFGESVPGRYVGAPMQHDFRDADSPDRGVWIYEFEKGGQFNGKFHELESPKFHIAKWELPHLVECAEQADEGDYIRVVAEMTHSEWTAMSKEIEVRCKELADERNVRVLPLHKPVYHHEVRLDTDGGVILPEEAVSKYLAIANTDGLSDDKLKEIALGALREVGRNEPGAAMGAAANVVHLKATDFCCLKEVSLGLYRIGLVLVIGENRDTDAADNNGAGKSTIFKAVTWCLFGETIDGDRYDEVIRWGAKRAEVAVLLAAGDETWIVRRWRTKGKPGLSLHIMRSKKDGERRVSTVEEPWPGDTKAVQAKVVELVGLDFRGFCNTVLYGQGDVDRFFSSTDTAQKETLHRALRTDVYRKAELWLRDVLNKSLRPKVEGAQRDLDKADARYEEHDVEEIERAFDEWEAEHDREVKERADEVIDLTRRARAVDDAAAARREELEAERAELEAALAAAAEKDAELDKVVGLREEAQEKLTAAGRARNAKDEELKSAQRQLALLDGDRCPTCTAPLARGAPAKFAKQLKTRSGQLAGELEAASIEVERLDGEVERLTRERDGIRDWLYENAVPDGKLADVKADIAALGAEAKTEKASLKRQAAEALAAAGALAKKENPHRRSLDQAHERAKELSRLLHEATSKRDAAQLDVAHHEFWVRGFGVQGLPSILLDGTMPYLTERANHYLETLSDGDIAVCFDTQRELKSKKGEKRDELEIAWTIEGVPGATPSNGQKRKLEVATDLALMDLVSSREGELDLLLMDEVLDGLDREGVARVLQLLQQLRAKRGSVLVVTHEPGLAESFERVVHVVKSGGASTLKEVS